MTDKEFKAILEQKDKEWGQLACEAWSAWTPKEREAATLADLEADVKDTLLSIEEQKFPIVVLNDNGQETYREEENGHWVKREYDEKGRQIYWETSRGLWAKHQFDDAGNEIYHETSEGFWYKAEYNDNGFRTYYEDSNAKVVGSKSVNSAVKDFATLDMFKKALDFYGYHVDDSLVSEFLLKHAESLIAGYKDGVADIDMDFWMQYEELLGDKMSYEEYVFVDLLYEGDPLELIDVELTDDEKALFGKLKAALDDFRAGKVNETAVALLVEAYKEIWTPDKNDDIYQKISVKANEGFAEAVCKDLEEEYSSWFEKDNTVDGLIEDAQEKATSYNEAKKLEEHTYGNHIFMRLEVDGEVHEVSNYAGADGAWDTYKTTADGTDKRDAVIQAFQELY